MDPDRVKLDHAEFAACICHLRESTSSVVSTVLDVLLDGGRCVERHRVEPVQHDRTVIAREVPVIARSAQDGRFLIIDETSLPAA